MSWQQWGRLTLVLSKSINDQVSYCHPGEGEGVYIVEWPEGFFTMAAVGTNNVGSIKDFHDPVRYCRLLVNVIVIRTTPYRLHE